jgi:hypothetical protein
MPVTRLGKTWSDKSDKTRAHFRRRAGFAGHQ